MGINVNKLLKNIILGGDLFFIYLNSSFWHSTFLGVVLLALFFILTNQGYKNLLVKFFNFSNSALAQMTALFFNFLLLGYGWGILVVFYKINNETLIIPFLFSAVISWLFSYWTSRAKETELVDSAKSGVVTELPKNNFHLLFFFIILFAGFYALKASSIFTSVTTPWEVVTKNYVYLIFLLFIILLGLILSKFKTNLLLFLTILVAFLFSSLLPLTSNYIYGADGWRHIASETQILEGEKYEPVVYGSDNLTLIQKINPGRFSYAQFWGVNVALSKILNINLVNITRWLLPVLWSIFFVLLIFELGVSLGLSETHALLLTVFSFWPFSLQVIGFFSLPASLGFLSFLFLLLLWVKRKKQQRKEQVWILFCCGALSVFGYILYFLVFWLLWVLSGILSLVASFSSKALNAIVGVFSFILVSIIIPLLEIFSGYSNLNLKYDFWWEGIKQFFGNIFAFYLASGPREHMIDTGNIFFYQTPNYAFFPNGFTAWRYWMVIFMLLIFSFFVYGVLKFLKSREVVYRVWGISSLGLSFSYILSRYFLSGENILTRRMDALLALFILVIVFFATRKFWQYKKTAIVLSLVLSIIITVSYSLGPVSRSISQDEYLAVENVLKEIPEDYPCVVGDTYQLLVLEALSGKKIAGGGFPIDEYFSQPELINIYRGFVNNKNIYYFAEAKKITNARNCIFIVPSGIIKEEAKNFQEQGIELKSFNSISVLKM